MPSPADRQAEANEDVERLAKVMFEAVQGGWKWDDIVGRVGERVWLAHARKVFESGVVKPVPRPKPERPMEGQTTIDDACTDHIYEVASARCVKCNALAPDREIEALTWSPDA
jgi:hypothetical protein